ncbi:MAG TPA: hypothetical protein VGR84_13310 [Candidatus Acidoferrales bacterium]|nr:hypothetical protein [Candidatus Acidoferrales bacterium]
MPDSSRDWRGEAARKLADSKLSAAEREEISRELAGYLEDLYSDARSRGLDEWAAIKCAASELHEDQHLGAHLYRARREGMMNDRTKRLWLPALTMLLVSAASLGIFQFVALWMYRVYTPMPHAQNYPELVHNVMRHDGAALMIYLGWLYTLPFLGALGAYWSRRCGSDRPAQITAGLFPLLLFFAIFVGQGAVGQRGTSVPFLAMDVLPPAHLFFIFLSVSSNLLLNWIVIPGAALLLGVLPFLRDGASRANAQRVVERASHHA